jgi:hypothetical protein
MQPLARCKCFDIWQKLLNISWLMRRQKFSSFLRLVKDNLGLRTPSITDVLVAYVIHALLICGHQIKRA